MNNCEFGFLVHFQLDLIFVLFFVFVSPHRIAVNLLPNKMYARNTSELRGVFANQDQQLEYLGVRTVNIRESDWDQILEHERIPYLLREIRMKLNGDIESS